MRLPTINENSREVRLVPGADQIFATIQGEGLVVGRPAVFVRFHGCDFACDWCDTKHSWKEGSPFVTRTLTDVQSRVFALTEEFGSESNFPMLVITGGNPMLQPQAVRDLAMWRVNQGQILRASRYIHDNSGGPDVVIETNRFLYNHFEWPMSDLIQRENVAVSFSPKIRVAEDGFSFFWEGEGHLSTFDGMKAAAKMIRYAKIVIDRNVLRALDFNEYGPERLVDFLTVFSGREIVIQPEWSLTREEVKKLSKHVLDMMRHPRSRRMRLLTQMHKSLGVL